ncbi:MAG: sodium:calcium antiporter [Thiobacillaceae bacterium]|nr:sodium:calcium antiporter [Thiobacillaceae bacterium]MCX7673554.1 sodium:calcium antiporter [Thiobacillaceae bacterium]
MLIWAQFLLCLLLIAVAGYRLSLYGDMIAEKLGLTRTWIGVILVASVTSLPELVSGISAVTAAHTPDIAVGDVLGSCVFNLVLIVVIDFLQRQESVYTRAHVGHTLTAAFGVILIGFVGLNLLLARAGLVPSLGHVGLYTPVIVLLYALAMRVVFQYEQMRGLPTAEVVDARYQAVSLRRAAWGYALAAAVVVAAGVWLPFVAKAVAAQHGWGEGFVGTLFVAAVTSAPEAAVSIAAVRLGALDLALGNLFGSNLFNMVILALDDLAYTQAPLFSAVEPAHAVSALSAMVMSGIAIVGLFYRTRQRVLRAVGWTSLFLLAVYLVNAYALYLYGR